MISLLVLSLQFKLKFEYKYIKYVSNNDYTSVDGQHEASRATQFHQFN